MGFAISSFGQFGRKAYQTFIKMWKGEPCDEVNQYLFFAVLNLEHLKRMGFSISSLGYLEESNKKHGYMLQMELSRLFSFLFIYIFRLGY